MRENMLFTKEEYKRRVRKTKEMMDKGGMEMLLVMGLANINPNAVKKTAFFRC